MTKHCCGDWGAEAALSARYRSDVVSAAKSLEVLVLERDARIDMLEKALKAIVDTCDDLAKIIASAAMSDK